MKKVALLSAAVLIISPAFAQGGSTGSQGASKSAPGQQMHNSKDPSTAPGASEYAPGHQRNTSAGPGHSESAPGQHMKTTGSNSGRK